MGEADDWRAGGDDLSRFGRNEADDAVGVGLQRRVVERVARQRTARSALMTALRAWSAVAWMRSKSAFAIQP